MKQGVKWQNSNRVGIWTLMSEIFRFEITNEASVFNALPLMLDGDGRLVVFLYMGGASQEMEKERKTHARKILLYNKSYFLKYFFIF